MPLFSKKKPPTTVTASQPTNPASVAKVTQPPREQLKIKEIATITTQSNLVDFSLFVKEIKPQIKELNKQINKYNKTTDTAEKISLLRDIFQFQKRIDNQFPATLISGCPSYRTEIHNKLFKAIKKQCALLGVPSILEVSLPASNSDVRAQTNPVILTEILANMEPDTVGKMLEILSAGEGFDKSKLAHLYDPADPEHFKFQEFLRTHEINFLGGKRSKNFKITGIPDITNVGRQIVYVLKVDNRLDAPREIDASIRESSIRDVLIPNGTERQASMESSKEVITRTLLVTEYCEGGSLEDHSLRKTNNTKKINSALDIYSQMGGILKKISNDNYAFPDMKNSNWLIDKNGLVRIADTKSFLFSEDGKYDRYNSKNRWFSFSISPFIAPPEVEGENWKEPFSTDKMHAYMLGKNIYEYLSGPACENLLGKHNGKDFSFGATVFKTEEGQQLKKLIIDLVKPDPTARISVSEALSRLDKIKITHEIRDILSSFNDLPKEGRSRDLLEYIKDLKVKIDSGPSLEVLQRFKGELQAKFDETKELIEVKKVCTAILGEILKLDIPENNLDLEDFIDEKRDKIGSESSLKALPPLKKALEEKLAESIKLIEANKASNAISEAQQECRAILQNIGKLAVPEKNIDLTSFIKTKEDAIRSASSLEALRPLKGELNGKLDEIKELIAAKKAISDAQQECRAILQNIGKLAVPENNPDLTNFTRTKEKAIRSTSSLEALRPLKGELNGKLDEIKELIAAKVKCKNILEEIKKSGFGEKDIGMKVYDEKQTKKIGAIQNKGAAEEVLKALNKELILVKDYKAFPQVNTLIESFRSKAIRGVTIGMKDKANRIEDALLKVPPPDRSSINNADTAEKKAVLEAIASHRHWGKKGKDVYTRKDIDPDKAAKSFKPFDRFKEGMQDLKAGKPTSKPEPKTELPAGESIVPRR